MQVPAVANHDLRYLLGDGAVMRGDNKSVPWLLGAISTVCHHFSGSRKRTEGGEQLLAWACGPHQGLHCSLNAGVEPFGRVFSQDFSLVDDDDTLAGEPDFMQNVTGKQDGSLPS